MGDQPIVYYESGLGPPLLLIHGLGGCGRWWFPLIPGLTAARFRVIAVDLPGFGLSPGPAAAPDAAASVIRRFAERLDLTRFTLCGHSMGGAIALATAARSPDAVRRLVLIDSAGVPDSITARAVLRLVQPWSWCPRGFYTTLLGGILRAGPRSLLTSALAVRRLDVRPLLEHVEMPTLVIWGERDTLTPPHLGRVLADALPNARLETIERARHLPMVTHPEMVGRLMTGFLSEERGDG